MSSDTCWAHGASWHAHSWPLNSSSFAIRVAIFDATAGGSAGAWFATGAGCAGGAAGCCGCAAEPCEPPQAAVNIHTSKTATLSAMGGDSTASQYDFAHTTRFALGLPVNGQVPGSPAASGMQRTVTP